MNSAGYHYQLVREWPVLFPSSATSDMRFLKMNFAMAERRPRAATVDNA